MKAKQVPGLAGLATCMFIAAERVVAAGGESPSAPAPGAVTNDQVTDPVETLRKSMRSAALRDDCGLDSELDSGDLDAPAPLWSDGGGRGPLAEGDFAPVISSSLQEFSLAMFQDPAPSTPPGTAGEAAGFRGKLAEQATNPVAPLIQLQFQIQYNGENIVGDGSSGAFIVQPVVPWKLGEFAMLSRFTLPFLSTPDLGAPIGREYGIGDFVALNAMVFKIKDGPWAGMTGPILTITAPTASSDFTGSGKWQAGPGFIYINTATKGLQWGLFGYQQWSFASSGGNSNRKEVSKLFFQPILTKHFDKNVYLALGDLLWSVDWNDNTWSIPFGIRLGQVTKFGKQPVNLFIEPFYDLSTSNTGAEWGIKLNLTLLFPQ